MNISGMTSISLYMHSTILMKPTG